MAFDCIASVRAGRGYRRGMSPRARIFALVALAAAVASGVVVLGVLATRSDVPSPKLRPGRPPLALDLGVRTDAEARALERAQTVYNDGRPRRAAAIFAGRRSLEARVGAAFAAWPDGSLERLQALAADHPRSALVALHLGLALYWSHRDAEAVTAWRGAATAQPDTPYAVHAADFLHPRFAPGLPVFVPSFTTPLPIRVLPPGRQVAALARMARMDGPYAKILYGVALQRLGRPRSASSTRTTRPWRSAGWVRSPAPSRTRRPSGSTSGCCCSGWPRSGRPAPSCASPERKIPDPRLERRLRTIWEPSVRLGPADRN